MKNWLQIFWTRWLTFTNLSEMIYIDKNAKLRSEVKKQMKEKIRELVMLQKTQIASRISN